MSPNKIQFSTFKLYVFSSRSNKNPVSVYGLQEHRFLYLMLLAVVLLMKTQRRLVWWEKDWDARQPQQIPDLHLLLPGWSSSHPSAPPTTPPPQFPCTPRFLLYRLGIFPLLFFYYWSLGFVGKLAFVMNKIEKQKLKKDTISCEKMYKIPFIL